MQNGNCLTRPQLRSVAGRCLPGTVPTKEATLENYLRRLDVSWFLAGHGIGNLAEQEYRQLRALHVKI